MAKKQSALSAPVTPQIVDAEIIEDRPQALVYQQKHIDVSLLAPVVDLNTALAELKKFQEFVDRYLVEGTEGEGDFGTLPGTKRKCLHQSGAHKLCDLFGFAPTFPDNRIRRTERWDMTPPLFDYEVTCVLQRKGTPYVIAEGLGSCSSYETKYRYRQSNRKCPDCQAEAIIKGKDFNNTGLPQGWVCFKKKGGCGNKFQDGDQRIEGQTIGRVPNEDMADSKNTILKIAVKRALVSAVIAATRSSGIFTPDMEHAEETKLDSQEDQGKRAVTQNSEAAPKPETEELEGTIDEFKETSKNGMGAVRLKTENGVYTLAVDAKPILRAMKGAKGEFVRFGCTTRMSDKQKPYYYVEQLLAFKQYDFTSQPGVDQYFADMREKENKAKSDPPPASAGSRQSGAMTSTATPTPTPGTQTTSPFKPKIDKIEVDIGTEKKPKLATWYELTGVVSVKGNPREVGKSVVVSVGIEGLDDYRQNPTGLNNRFDCWHKSLHAALSNIKQGSKIKFQYFPELSADEKKQTQYIEEVLEIDGVLFEKGKVIARDVDASASSIPTGLF